ncbi:hypothetical protein ABT039_22900 [Streptomyces lasiicapitis]|uniref:hypothetical protein n=1 Tax=Streptomyces lasiicapitis TaxID=1923961 RepID=UPI00331BEB40
MTDCYETSWDDGNQDIAEAVMWAADEGKPLLVTTASGRTVRLVPDAGAAADTAGPPSDPLDGITVQEVSRSSRQLRSTTEYTQVLRVDGTPELSAGSDATTLVPELVWIEYVVGQKDPARFRAAHVSGYRVTRTGKPDLVVSTSLFEMKALPGWLDALVSTYRQSA